MTARVMEQPMTGELAPPFRLNTTDGEVTDLADYAGRFVIIHFGTSW